ncbi:hypothetical protein HaLaN_03425, partial [Haematococcus lacustris]
MGMEAALRERTWPGCEAYVLEEVRAQGGAACQGTVVCAPYLELSSAHNHCMHVMPTQGCSPVTG